MIVGIDLKLKESKNTLLSSNDIFNRISKCVSNVKFSTKKYDKVFNLIDTEEKSDSFFASIVANIMLRYKDFTDTELLTRGIIYLVGEENFNPNMINQINKNMCIMALTDIEIINIFDKMNDKLEDQYKAIMSVF